MSLNQTFLEIIYNIVTKQNEYLLSEISLRENIPYTELHNVFLKNPRKNFKNFIDQLSLSSDADDSSSGGFSE